MKKRWMFWQGLEWAGLASLSYGCYLVHPVAGFVVGGLLAVITAVQGAAATRRRR